MTYDTTDVYLCSDCSLYHCSGDLPEDDERAQEIQDAFDANPDVSYNEPDDDDGYRESSVFTCFICNEHSYGKAYCFATRA